MVSRLKVAHILSICAVVLNGQRPSFAQSNSSSSRVEHLPNGELLYTVEYGETLSAILHKLKYKGLWGSSGYVSRVAKMNVGAVKEEGNFIREGIRIRLPVLPDATPAQDVSLAEASTQDIPAAAPRFAPSRTPAAAHLSAKTESTASPEASETSVELNTAGSFKAQTGEAGTQAPLETEGVETQTANPETSLLAPSAHPSAAQPATAPAPIIPLAPATASPALVNPQPTAADSPAPSHPAVMTPPAPLNSTDAVWDAGSIKIESEFSYARLASTDADNQAEAVLISDLGKGVNLSWNQNWTDAWSSSLFVGTRQLNYQLPQRDRTLKDSSINVSRFGLGVETRLKKDLTLSLSGGFAQTSYLRAVDATQLDLVNITQKEFSAEVSQVLVRKHPFAVDLRVGGSWFIPQSVPGVNIGSSWGYHYGMGLTQKLRNGWILNGGLIYQQSVLKTNLAPQEIDYAIFTFGLEFGLPSAPEAAPRREER